jgi:hypothetical protein
MKIVQTFDFSSISLANVFPGHLLLRVPTNQKSQGAGRGSVLIPRRLKSSPLNAWDIVEVQKTGMNGLLWLCVRQSLVEIPTALSTKKGWINISFAGKAVMRPVPEPEKKT